VMSQRRAASSNTGGVNPCRRALALSWWLAFAIVLGVGGSVTASAAPKQFNGFVGGTNGVNTGGLFTQPRDVAIYTANTASLADDKIFLTEALTGNSRVQRLDADGNFELLWGRDVVRTGAVGNMGTGYEVCSAAVSGAAGCKSAPVGVQAGEFDNPAGITVNQTTGHVYVMDRGNWRVQEFDLDGEFIRAWGWGVGTGAAAFEVCAVACQAGVAGTGAGQFGNATHNAIAISPLASSDVFVTDSGNRRIMQFEADGDFVRGWGFDVAPGGVPAFEVCEGTGSACQSGQSSGGPADNGEFATDSPQQMAIDQAGIIYASDTASSNRVMRFGSDPTPAASLAPLSSPDLLSAGQTLGLEIDVATGNLLAARDPGVGPVVVDEVASPGAELPPAGPPNPIVVDAHTFSEEGIVKGLGVNPGNGDIYLAALALFAPPTGPFTGCVPLTPSFSCNGLVVLATGTGSITPTLQSPFNVGATSALLAGSLDPGGGVARYRFQVSEDGANWEDAAEFAYAGGASPVDVAVAASDLEPATLYRVRLQASKQTGIATSEEVVSNEALLLTDAVAPTVSALGPSNRTNSSVRMRGLVDPQGSSTNYRFEYGPVDGSFDHHIPVPDAQVGAGNASQAVHQDITGLQPETAYQYRLVATNFVGATVGDVVKFTTKAAGSLPPAPAGRAYELVSPADKVAGVGVGVWYHGPGTAGIAGHAAYKAERFAVQGTFGAMLVDGKQAYMNDWALSERTPQGWVSQSVFSRRAHGSQTLVAITLGAATEDLSLSTWSGTTVKLFAEMEDWITQDTGNVLYLRDWTPGRWEIFGPTDPAQSDGAGLTSSVAVASDGGSLVASGMLRGLAGSGDPSLDLAPTISNVYLDEVPAGPSDTFPGAGVRSLVNVCSLGTRIPERVDLGGGSFKLGSQSCPAPQPGRDGVLISQGGAELGDSRERVVSADGSRVFFMSPESGNAPSQCSGVGVVSSCPRQVYVRQRDSDGVVVTRWISRTEVTEANGASADQDSSLMGQAIFEGASVDGDKVFFRAASPLTADDPNGEGQAPPVGGVVTGVPSQDSWDLYMYDMPDSPDADPAGGELTRISAGPTGQSDCNSPVDGGSGAGALRFVSEDGLRLYFTCAAALEGVPLAGNGTSTMPGGAPSTSSAVNLYLYDATKSHAERWRFVARLPTTSPIGPCATRATRTGMPLGAGTVSPNVLIFPVNCVRGIPDASYAALWTDGQLTDDDPDASSADIYAYDATEDELTRVTAPQGGVGGTYACAPPSSVQCYGDGGIGPPSGSTSLPALGIAEIPGSDQHVVFFESETRLIPGDDDANYDVYQWRDGALTLISSNSPSTGDALFKGNDITGTNVYFASRDRLSWQDKDSVLDIYSARIGTGIPQPHPGESCSPIHDQCQEAGQAVDLGQIESVTGTDGNPSAARRVRLAIKAPSALSRRQAARTGRLKVRIAASTSVPIVVTAKTTVRGKTRHAAQTVRRTIGAGVSVLTLRLNTEVLRRIGAGRKARIALRATAPGSRASSVRLTLRR
jgi:hypothetical protein